MTTVYKFYKDNCAPCYNLNRILNVINVPENIEIIPKNVNLDENKILAKSFGIDKVPALLFESGKSLIGQHNKDEVVNFLSV